MEKNNYLDDISEIKNIMNKSSRFISLSGISGIFAGIYALIGAFIAYTFLSDYKSATGFAGNLSISSFEFLMIAIAFLVVLFSVITSIILTTKKAKRNNEKIWDNTVKRMLLNFLIPLISGGLFALVLLQYGFIGLIAPTTLIFYGLSCINASKYTLGDIRYLGISILIIGLISTQFIGYGLYFWALGFGIFHIIYGIVMYLKYDKK